jgi:pimeloyl-ACP methyl ester carboxylesterase
MVYKPQEMLNCASSNPEGPESKDIQIAYFDVGPREGVPVFLIHGFASSAHVNWVFTGWVKTLTDAGYRVIALDHRGHGASEKPHEPEFYTPSLMARDATNLLDHLNIADAHFIGYSMGARVSAFVAKSEPQYVRSLTFGGLGIGLVEGVGDWDPIADALLAPSLDEVTHERGRMFRAFADQTKSDRYALAACIASNRVLVTEAEASQMAMPTLIVVGTEDDIAGSPEELEALMPNATAIDVPGRDHMLTVGDKVFKAAVLDQLSQF